jgi:DNA-binding MarR family transcriptional regulator
MYHQQQPNEEALTVSVTRKDISAARRLLRILVGVDRTVATALENDAPVTNAFVGDREILVERARAVFRNRRRRSKVFGQSMFGEAAWDMLLALYIMERSGPRHRVGDLMKLAGTPTTTANRWLAFLISHGFVAREEHPTDRRTSFAKLTDVARAKMDEYFSETV